MYVYARTHKQLLGMSFNSSINGAEKMKTFSPCRFFLRGYSKLRAHVLLWATHNPEELVAGLLLPEEEAKIVLEGILSAFLQWHQLTERMTSSKCENFQKRLCVELSYKCAIAYHEEPLKKEARQKKVFLTFAINSNIFRNIFTKDVAGYTAMDKGCVTV